MHDIATTIRLMEWMAPIFTGPCGMVSILFRLLAICEFKAKDASRTVPTILPSGNYRLPTVRGLGRGRRLLECILPPLTDPQLIRPFIGREGPARTTTDDAFKSLVLTTSMDDRWPMMNRYRRQDNKSAMTESTWAQGK